MSPAAMSNDDIKTPPAGLPDYLPQGERILWQGAPGFRALANQAFHCQSIAIYFALMLGWYGVATIYDGQAVSTTLSGLLVLSAVAGGTVGLLATIAWFASRTTVYTITNRRIVLRIGIALPMTINIPFAVVKTATLKLDRSGHGDIHLVLEGHDLIAFLFLWPHTRPWHVAKPQPTLRAIPDAVRVAECLAQALAGNGAVLAPQSQHDIGRSAPVSAAA